MEETKIDLNRTIDHADEALKKLNEFLRTIEKKIDDTPKDSVTEDEELFDLNKPISNAEDANIVFYSFSRTEDSAYALKFIEFLKTKPTYFLKLNLTYNYEALFFEDETGKSIIQYLIENNINIDYNTSKFMANNYDILLEFLNNNNTSLLQYTDEENLYGFYVGDKRLIDFLFEKNAVSKEVVGRVYNNKDDIINKILTHDEHLLCGLDEFTIFSKKINDTLIIDYMFQKNLVDKDFIRSIYLHTEIVDLCEKYNRTDLLEHLSESLMLKNMSNGEVVLDYLLNNNYKPKCFFSREESFEILINHNDFEFISSLGEFYLLKTVKEKTLLEILIEKGISIDSKAFYNKDSLKIFSKYNMYNNMCDYRLDLLLLSKDLNETYLEQLLNAFSNGENINLSKIKAYSSDNEVLSNFYLMIAKYDLLIYFDDITKERLLRDKNGVKLIDILLQKDKDLTLNKIIPKNVKEDFDVAMYLRLKGIEQNEIKMDLFSEDIVEDYFKEFNSGITNVVVDEESQRLLDEFKSLMLSDNLSDPNFVEDMISSYRYMIASSNPYGLVELRKLIEIKKNDSNFCIKKINEGGFYRKVDNSINLENSCLNTLNHETGHALYHNLSSVSRPVEFDSMIFNLRRNPDVLAKVNEYSIKIQEIKKSINELVESKYMKEYDEKVASMDKSQIIEFLNKSKEEKMKAYIEKGYSEETLDIILNNTFSLEEYLTQERRIIKGKLVDAIMRSEYGSFITIGDILDGIFEGRFRDNKLLNKDNNIIPSCYGHGISYYARGNEWAFDECMANFSAIIKSPDAREIMSYLKNIVGEEFINCIQQFYTNEIAFSKKNLEERKIER